MITSYAGLLKIAISVPTGHVWTSQISFVRQDRFIKIDFTIITWSIICFLSFDWLMKIERLNLKIACLDKIVRVLSTQSLFKLILSSTKRGLFFTFE